MHTAINQIPGAEELVMMLVESNRIHRKLQCLEISMHVPHGKIPALAVDLESGNAR